MADRGPGATSLKKAIERWQRKTEENPAEAEVVKGANYPIGSQLYMQMPPMAKLDNNLMLLKNVVHLSLSTNAISNISHLNGLNRLETLSLARNNLKNLNGIEAVAATLVNLWVSYNSITDLRRVVACKRLKQFYVRNNLIGSWSQANNLAELPELEDLEFAGNKLQIDVAASAGEEAYIDMWKQRLPNLKRLDGMAVYDSDEELRANEADGEDGEDDSAGPSGVDGDSYSGDASDAGAGPP